MTTRREFIKTSAAGSAGLWLAGSGWTQTQARRRYAIVGTGGRHAMYREAILGRFTSSSELVGLCDINIGRARLSPIQS